MNKNANYQALVEEISAYIYNSRNVGSHGIPQSQIKEFFVSNGQDLKDFDTFLKDISETLAGMAPK